MKRDFDRNTIPQAYKEISIYDLIKFQECPKKYEFFLEEKELTASEQFHALCRRHVTNIAKDILAGTAQKVEVYTKRAKHEVENTIYGLAKLGRTSQYTNRIEQIILNFLNEFGYSGERVPVGMGLASGFSRVGHRVLAGSDITVSMARSKQTRTYIFTFGTQVVNPFFNSHILRAATLYEGYRREGVQLFVYLYNLNTCEEVAYDHPRLHDTLVGTIKALLNRLDLATDLGGFYYNIGSWCSYCPFLESCYHEALTK